MIRDNLHLMSSSSSSAPATSCSQSSSYSASWTRAQDKLFEQALVIFPEETPNRWEKIASQVPGKTALEVEQHYQVLVDDVNAIEAGLVELPCYTDDLVHRDSSSSKPKPSETTERRKGTPWTEEEHKLFLIGLQKYGKGDWRSISRNAVVSRTPTQVASHAQKYFNRINSDKKEKKRSSIHDITVDDASVLPVPVPGSDSSQQTMVGLSGQTQQGRSGQTQQAMDQFSAQVPFNSGGGGSGSGSGYQSYGYPM